MSLKSRLAMMATTVALASTPAIAQNSNENSEIKSNDTPWYQTAWEYTGGALGKGISYVGKGISITGDGIGWTMDKVTYPIRKTGEILKSANDKVGDYVRSAEETTHIPLGTVGGIVRMPGKVINSITENTSDFLTEGPDHLLGVAGNTIGVAGNTISADAEGIKKSGKELGSNTWELTKTTVADAGPLALHGAATSLPVDGFARDVLAVSHMSVNLAQKGEVGNVIPESLTGAVGYTVMRSLKGVEYADSVIQKASEENNIQKSEEKIVQKEEQNNKNNKLILEKMKERGRG